MKATFDDETIFNILVIHLMNGFFGLTFLFTVIQMQCIFKLQRNGWHYNMHYNDWGYFVWKDNMFWLFT